ncbi:glycosyltransferase family 4 protein [Vibrio sp. EJY3]|uniref:glycosyltransferase family 4 protein n=1 Tax=Vibrio sp. (strain EJY3) TaxID=1116375 RepID=UPI000243A5D1|nr:glycosyltransferase family 4 protein [Vibrio sp. EJY3]AEX20721.1 group 1 glycosyl transferase [Vibrio sp. EJY3]
MLNIVYICNEYPPSATGGIGIFTQKLAESLATKGNKITVVGLYQDCIEEKHEKINGVKVIRLPAKGGRLGLFNDRYNLYKTLKQLSIKKNIDIIECPDFEATLAFVPKVAKHMLTRLHGSHTYFSAERNVEASNVVKFCEARQLKTSHKVVSVSRYTAEVTRDLFSLKVLPDVIYNSVDVTRFTQHIKQDYSTRKKAIYFGTLVEKKGIYPLAFAWKQFQSNNPDWTLTVIGKDAKEGGKSNKIRMQKLLGDASVSVNFIEHMPNEELVSSLKEYDFCVLPSFSEAFALAPMEAMAAGLPTIVSSMSSGPELVKHGIDGWLCDPQDTATVLNALNLAAASEETREKVGQAGQRKINEYFSFDDFVQNNINYYNNL